MSKAALSEQEVIVAVHRGEMMADTLSFTARVDLVNF